MLEFAYEDVIKRILERNPWRTEGVLAEKLNISPNTWTAYKRGKRSFGLHEIAKICEILDIDPFWLLFGDMDDPDLAVLLGGLVKDRQIASRFAGPDLELISKEADHPNTGGALIDPGLFLDIERAVTNSFKTSGSSKKEEVIRTTVAWYNEFLASGLDLSDRKEVEARIYLKGKELSRSLSSQGNRRATARRGQAG